MGSIDDFWRQLNVKKGPKATLSGLSNIPGLTTHSRTLPAKGSASPALPAARFAAALAPSELPDQQGLQISQLKSKLFPDGENQKAQDVQLLQQIVSGPMLVPVVRLLGDPVEKCREGSLTLLASAAEQLPEPAALLSCLMPAVADRMGDVPVEEPSEELRLAIIRLIAGPVILRSGQCLLPYLTLVVKVVCRALEDPFHDIKKAGCSAIANLCKQLPSDALRPQHDALLASLLPNLGHQHSRVRVSTLAALDTLVTKGVSEQAMVQVIAPAVKPLVSDRASAVKEQCFAAVGSWLGASRQGRLLTAIISTSQSADDRLKSNDFASSSHSQASWPASFTHPFQAQPAATTQHMVQDILPAILPSVVTDLREWTVALRLNAARCLQSIFVLAGAAPSAHLPHLLSPLCSAAGDEEEQVAHYVVQAAQVLGAFVKLGHWLPLMVDSVAAPQASLPTRVNALVVLSAMLHAAGVVQQSVDSEQLLLLVGALCSDAVRGVDQAPAQQQLLAVIYNTISLAGGQCSLLSQQLWLLLLQLQASESSQELAMQAATASQRLAAACGQSSIAGLAAMHAPSLTSALAQNVDSWTAHSPDCHVFSVLLLSCPGTTLSALIPQALQITCSILPDPERDPALRIHLLQLLERMTANEDQAKALQGAAAQHLADQALLPALVWHAGKTAAAVRFAAISALSTLLAHQLLGFEQLQAMLAGNRLLPMLFQSLEEEYFVDTRLAACSATYHLLISAGKLLTYEQCRLTYPELLKRLDDSSNAVRTSICAALKVFVDNTSSSLDDGNAKYFINGMLIHMDDMDPVIQEAVCTVLEIAAAHRPALVNEAVSTVSHLHRNSIYTSRVLKACER
ncbi:MAG: hypothetical protein FRX49_10473 [Trebouxia sp. A1-2]|nr:MAG: hypothetical protein FRX49_10473 [Trebouxia sp. A1-2]